MKTNKILKSALGALVVGFIALHTSAAVATVIGEVEPNDTDATAQNVNGSFSLDFVSQISDNAGNNTSTTLSHVSILGTGNGTFDYYSFASLGGLTILDVDFGHNSGGSVDLEIGIWNSLGSLLAFNDDSQPTGDTGAAGGSLGAFDSFIQLGVAAGTYTVGVCAFNCSFADSFVMSGNVPSQGATYTLHISTATGVPEPSVIALFALGLFGFGFARRRKHS